MAEIENAVAVIMAGGEGTRFWPLSTPEKPKQYLKLFGGKTLLSATLERLRGAIAQKGIFICSAASQKKLVELDFPHSDRIMSEPFGRNTAPCLMLALSELLKKGLDKKTIMIALAADHYVSNEPRFRELLSVAAGLARETNGLVTLGIKPSSAHTGYGYIEAGKALGKAFQVSRFVEKPDENKAREFLAKGNFYWNAGIFVWTLGALEKAFETYTPESWKIIRDASSLENAYSRVKAEPIDTAVMEKSSDVYLVPCDTGWTDVGSWNALYELLSKSPESNVVLQGSPKLIQSEGCLIHTSQDKKTAIVGAKNLIIIEDEKTGALLVADRAKDQLVREAGKDFEKTPPQH